LCLARNGFGAGSGNAKLGELLRSCQQNGGAAFLRLPARTHAGRVLTVAEEASHD
jgi:hypothetical protein